MSELTQRAARGRRVAQLQQDPDLVAIFEDCDARAVAAWRKATTVELREVAHADLQALERVRRQFRAIADDGRIAELELEKLNRRS